MSRGEMYCPFDDSLEGWNLARYFILWCGEPYPPVWQTASFTAANKLAREDPDKYYAWRVQRRLNNERYV